MNRHKVPVGAWMRLRQHGCYKFSRNKTPIVWTILPPPKGTTVYCISWKDSQSVLMYSEVIKI